MKIYPVPVVLDFVIIKFRKLGTAVTRVISVSLAGECVCVSVGQRKQVQQIAEESQQKKKGGGGDFI